MAATFWMIHRRPPVQKSENVQKQDKAAECFPISVNQSEPITYFPKGVFTKFPGGYNYFLSPMREPSLLLVPECVDESYRFLWLRAFDAPVAARIWRSGNEYYLVAKQLDWFIKDESFKSSGLKIVKSRPVNENEWIEFRSLIDKASFWNLPTNKGPIGFDGAQWVLEGNSNSQYHVVDRWSPTDKKYREACVYLMRMSGLEIDEKHYTDY